MRDALAARRRGTEAALGALVVIVIVGAYVLVYLAENPALPRDLGGLAAAMLGLFAAAHLAVRRFAPRADPTLLPLAALLNGIGFVMITRLDRDRAAADALGPAQAVWTAVGIAAFVVVLVVVRDIRGLARYRYTFLLLGLAALMLPLVPGVGQEVYGARLWAKVGPVTFQPGEAAKVLLVVFFAAYLVEKRELLASGTRRLGRLHLPDPKHLGPLLVPWLASILIMVQEKDLGSSLMFFAVFVAMLYIATARSAYLLAGLLLFLGGAVTAYQLFGHVQVRVSTWLDPWPVAQGKGYQLVQSLFAFGTGGVAGTGLGLGSPGKIPQVSTDFIFSAIGEELGLVGTVAVVTAFILLVGSGIRIAVRSERDFPKLLAAGLAITIGLQAFVIMGGVTRMIPLTGITLPFVSYGGSSLVANYVALALLLRIADESNRHTRPARGRARTPAPVPARSP